MAAVAAAIIALLLLHVCLRVMSITCCCCMLMLLHVLLLLHAGWPWRHQPALLWWPRRLARRPRRGTRRPRGPWRPLLLLLLWLPLSCLLLAGYGRHDCARRHVVAPVAGPRSARPLLLPLLLLLAAAAARWAWQCWHAAAAGRWSAAVQAAAHFQQLLLHLCQALSCALSLLWLIPLLATGSCQLLPHVFLLLLQHRPVGLLLQCCCLLWIKRWLSSRPAAGCSSCACRRPWGRPRGARWGPRGSRGPWPGATC